MCTFMGYSFLESRVEKSLPNNTKHKNPLTGCFLFAERSSGGWGRNMSDVGGLWRGAGVLTHGSSTPR